MMPKDRCPNYNHGCANAPVRQTGIKPGTWWHTACSIRLFLQASDSPTDDKAFQMIEQFINGNLRGNNEVPDYRSWQRQSATAKV